MDNKNRLSKEQQDIIVELMFLIRCGRVTSAMPNKEIIEILNNKIPVNSLNINKVCISATSSIIVSPANQFVVTFGEDDNYDADVEIYDNYRE